MLKKKEKKKKHDTKECYRAPKELFLLGDDVLTVFAFCTFDLVT